jgi:hypothetical protein
MKQMVNSFTVAGAVPALPESNQSAPASRLTCKEEICRHLNSEDANLPDLGRACQEIDCILK